MRSIGKYMITRARCGETPAKARKPRMGSLIVLGVTLTAFMIWSGLLLFSIPGAVGAVVSALTGPG